MEPQIGQRVRVKMEDVGTNRRVPEYARGRTGRILKVHGLVPGRTHDHAEEWGPLYSVVLDGKPPEGVNERVVVDVHAPWLEEAS